MKNKKIKKLIIKFISKAITAEELDTLSIWIEDPINEQLFKDYIKINYALDYNLARFNTEKSKIKIFNELGYTKRTNKVIRMPKLYKYAAAIIILVLVSTPFVFKDSFTVNSISKEKIIPILPGSDKAILTLESGNQIALEKGKNYANAKVVSNGENLVYQKNNNTSPERIAYNYLTIPKGGQFYVELSDGTKVWLNSESKLKYPVSFIDGKERKVELLYGEAYFDVTHSAETGGSKFVVNTNEQDITVLGTEFNVKAYADESNILTTLVKGKVNVTNGIDTKMLTPGLQSNLSLLSNTIELSEVDVTYETAWKNGYFMFDKEPLEKMLKTLSKWYDLEVVFEDDTKKAIVFSGLLNRSSKIEELLTNLQKTGEVEFTIENKKVIIK